MKYIALVVTLAFMAWTWSLAKSPSNFGLQEHQAIQENLEHLLTEQIQQERPNAKNIQFLQLYSETVIPERELLVHVRVAIQDTVGPITATSTGERGSDKDTNLEPVSEGAKAPDPQTSSETTEETTETLRRSYVLKSGDGTTWAILKRLPGTPEIEFKHGLRVTPRAGNDEEAVTPDSTNSPAPDAKQKSPTPPGTHNPPSGETKH